MLFSTILFLFRFLPATLLLYYISPPKLKNTTLFLCSLVFYCWGEVKFFWIMCAVILINYVCGILVGWFKTKDNLSMQRLFLILSIAGSLSMLLCALPVWPGPVAAQALMAILVGLACLLGWLWLDSHKVYEG